MAYVSLVCGLCLITNYSLFSVPPKGSKVRPKPYSTRPRQSTRRVVLTPRAAAARADQQGDQGTISQQVTNPPVQVNQTSASQPLPPSRDSVPVTRQPSTSNDNTNEEPQPSTSRDEPSTSHQIPIPQIQVESGVTRSEFQSLKDSMASMRSLFNDFMANFSANNNVVTPNVPIVQPVDHSHAFQRPISVPVNDQVIIQQPASINSNDNNISNNISVPVNAEHAASSMINQAMAAHIQSVTGDRVTGKPPTDKSRQLDRRIPPSVMQDIWEDKFIDLEILLDKQDDPTAPLALKTIQTQNFGEVLQVIKPKPPKGITNIDQWSFAFDIFMSMYTRKYFHETHNLLTYSNKIKELAQKGGDFLRYDVEFRKSRSRYGTPWEIPDLELWIDCKQAGLTNQVINIINSLNNNISPNLSAHPPTQPTSSLPSIIPSLTTPISSLPSLNPDPNKFKHPSGACYTFHNKGRCGRVPCSYSHLCYNQGCNESHSVFTCPLSPNSGLSSINISSPSPKGRGKDTTSSNPGATR